MVRSSILLIDDNPANLSLLTAYLEAQNYEVLIARTGESGLDKAVYAQPDLILLDLMLPGIDGFEVCRSLKENPETTKIPVIFMTSATDTEHKLRALRLGAVDYLTKPVQEEELLLRVNTHVRLSRLTHQLEAEVARQTCALQEEIREREQAQERLAYHAMLLQEISDAVISIDENFFIQSWNHAAETMYGWTEYEALGQAAPELFKTIYPDSNRNEFALMLLQSASYQGELIHHRKDGSALPVWVTVNALRDKDGKIYGYVSILRNISLQKEAEEQHLALARLQERTEVLNNLLGSVSHDLKTPLTIIETNLYFLDRLVDADKPREKIRAIRKQTAHLKKLIEDMLTMSRLDHQSRLAVSPILLNQLLQDIVASLDAEIRERELRIELILADLPTVQGNESELYRALINLIENAINYTPRGGLIQLVSGQKDGSVWIDVIDSGIGIGEEELPHIFERYYRADKARNINSGGTGLGLAIVKRVIEMHKGHIEVVSEPNQGTKFHLDLPIQPISDAP